MRGIYFITDRTYCALEIYDMVSAVLAAGIKIIQYRDKNRTRREIYSEAIRLRELTSRYSAALIINDHADIACAVSADGLHLGQDDLPIKEARKVFRSGFIGISTHSEKEAKQAAAEGADYIGFGPVFATTTKDAGLPQGLDNLARIKQNVGIPVVAIGGITADKAAAVFMAGADAVAVATGICKGDIRANAALFVQIATMHQEHYG